VKKFDNYLRKQEELIGKGELTEAERERAEFERRLRVCRSSLACAFSCAAGAAIVCADFQPGAIVGAPIIGYWVVILFSTGVGCSLTA